MCGAREEIGEAFPYPLGALSDCSVPRAETIYGGSNEIQENHAERAPACARASAGGLRLRDVADSDAPPGHRLLDARQCGDGRGGHRDRLRGEACLEKARGTTAIGTSGGLGEAAEMLAQGERERAADAEWRVTREQEVRADHRRDEELGHIDVLINNAGLGGTASVVEMSDEQWHAVLDVTLTSVFRMTRAVLPHMLARRRGAIVNNASVLGWRAQKGQAHYAAAKAGVWSSRCTAARGGRGRRRGTRSAAELARHES